MKRILNYATVSTVIIATILAVGMRASVKITTQSASAATMMSGNASSGMMKGNITGNETGGMMKGNMTTPPIMPKK